MSDVRNGQVVPSRQTDDVSLHLGSQSGIQMYVVLPCGLEGLTIDMPSRQTVTQALEGQWGDAKGGGIKRVTISGHTGWLVDELGLDGRDVFMKLVDLKEEHERRMAEQPNNLSNQIILSDPGSGQTLRVQSSDMHVIRDKSRPLLFQFSWDLQVVSALATFRNNTPLPATNHRDRPTKTPADPRFQPAAPRPSRAAAAKVITTAAKTTAPPPALAVTVKSGDTLYGLIQRVYNPATNEQRDLYFNAVVGEPRNAQTLRNPNLIYPGQIIYFPTRVDGT